VGHDGLPVSLNRDDQTGLWEIEITQRLAVGTGVGFYGHLDVTGAK